MVNWKDIEGLRQEKGYVSVSLLSDAFDLPVDESWRILHTCMEKGKLLPLQQSFFAPPDEEGNPRPYVSRAGSGDPEQRAKYYTRQLRLLREYFAVHDEVGSTIREVWANQQVADAMSQPTLRKVLDLMVELGELEKMTAEAGGTFGKHPLLYGSSTEALDAKNELVIEATAKKPKKKRKAKTPEAPTVQVSSREDIERRQRERDLAWEEGRDPMEVM